jgi:hypothetical protein
MKLLIVPRPALGDYVVSLYSEPTEWIPSIPIGGKMGKLPDDSPAFAAREKEEGSWFYRGPDYKEVYASIQITMGEELTTSVYERDYEAIRDAYPHRNLKPYKELSDEERGRHYQSYMNMQADLDELGRSIATSAKKS